MNTFIDSIKLLENFKNACKKCITEKITPQDAADSIFENEYDSISSTSINRATIIDCVALATKLVEDFKKDEAKGKEAINDDFKDFKGFCTSNLFSETTLTDIDIKVSTIPYLKDEISVDFSIKNDGIEKPYALYLGYQIDQHIKNAFIGIPKIEDHIINTGLHGKSKADPIKDDGCITNVLISMTYKYDRLYGYVSIGYTLPMVGGKILLPTAESGNLSSLNVVISDSLNKDKIKLAAYSIKNYITEWTPDEKYKQSSKMLTSGYSVIDGKDVDKKPTIINGDIDLPTSLSIKVPIHSEKDRDMVLLSNLLDRLKYQYIFTKTPVVTLKSTDKDSIAKTLSDTVKKQMFLLEQKYDISNAFDYVYIIPCKFVMGIDLSDEEKNEILKDAYQYYVNKIVVGEPYRTILVAQ